MVDLHYLVMVVPNYGLPPATSLPAPWGGAHFTHLCAGSRSLLGGLPPSLGVSQPLPPHWGRPRPGPGSEGPWGGPKGFFPFLPDAGRVCSPDPGPGLVARPPPPSVPSFLMPCWQSGGTCLSLFSFPWGGEPFLPSPLALLVGGEGRGPPFRPLPSPLSLPSPSPSGVTGPVARESLSGCPLERMDFKVPMPRPSSGLLLPWLDRPGGTSNTIGTLCLRLFLSDWQGLRNFPSTRLIYPAVSAHYSSGYWSLWGTGPWGFPFPNREIPGRPRTWSVPPAPSAVVI